MAVSRRAGCASDRADSLTIAYVSGRSFQPTMSSRSAARRTIHRASVRACSVRIDTVWEPRGHERASAWTASRRTAQCASNRASRITMRDASACWFHRGRANTPSAIHRTRGLASVVAAARRHGHESPRSGPRTPMRSSVRQRSTTVPDRMCCVMRDDRAGIFLPVCVSA